VILSPKKECFLTAIPQSSHRIIQNMALFVSCIELTFRSNSFSFR